MKLKMIFLILLRNLRKHLHRQPAVFKDRQMIKYMCFKSTTSTLTDQFFELVNFTGTKSVDKIRMFSLFLQKSLDLLKRKNWDNLCEEIGV